MADGSTDKKTWGCRHQQVWSTLVMVAVVALASGCGSRLSHSAVVAASTGAAGTTSGSSSSSNKGALGAGSTSSSLPNGSATGTGASGAAGQGNSGQIGAGSSGAGAQSGGGAGTSAAAPAAAGGGQATGSPIVLGSVGTSSGFIGADFAGWQQEEQVWAKYTNAHGGLNGHPVSVISADDGADPSTNLSLVQQMVTQDHVIAFVGNMTPLSIQGAESYLQQVHIPVIGGDLVSPDWFTNPDFFPQGTSITNQVVAMVKAAVAKGHKKFALVSCVESAVICNGATSAFSNEVKQAGATLAYQSSATLTAPSYTAQCVGAQQAGADFMYFESDGASLIRMADNCASQGYHPAYADTGLAATPTLLGDSNLNGTYFPSPVFPFTVGNTPATAAYQQAQKTYDPSLSSDGATALEWTAGELAVAASKDLGAAPTSAQFLQGLYSIQNNNLGGIAPPLTFTNGAPAASSSCSFDFDIQGGQWSAPSGATASC